jgi:predicted ribosome quality control (RQC) complex YloA/Tae2 family protein
MRVSIGNYFANVGKNAKDNWNILDEAEPCDIWFHLENTSSPYIILEVKNYDIISLDIITECAKLCKEKSKEKQSNKVSVIYTTVSNLKKGNNLGSVHLLDTPNKISV